jgi:hypothetical protein
MVLAFMAGMVLAQDSGKTGTLGNIKSIDLPIVTVQLKAGPDKIKVDTYCMICHSTDYITMQPPFSKAQWTATVNKMIKTYGAPIPPQDAEKIIDYLAASYGTGN